MADVFISYHTKSSGGFVEQISAALESFGISCWYAPRDVDFGDYASSIMDAIRQCKVFLLILNNEANHSGHIKNEVASAFERTEQRNCVILPFHADKSAISDDLLYYIRRFHRVEKGVLSDAEAIEALLPEIAKLLGRDLPKKKQIPRRKINWKDLLKIMSLTLLTLIGIGSFFGALWMEYGGGFQNAQAIEIASGECGNDLTWGLDGYGTLTISGKGKMWRFQFDMQEQTVGKSELRYDDEWLVRRNEEEWVVFTTAPWWDYRDKIMYVQIGEGVTSIGECAFLACGNLTNVSIPDSVTIISSAAFRLCMNLTSVSVPANAKIDDNAFDKTTDIIRRP